MNLAPKYSPYEPKKPRRIPFETFYKKYEKGWKGYNIEYFKAGVQTVWHIFPEQQLIYVFTSVKNITVCEGEDICSAAPALPEFNIMAQDIFKK